ncbi:MAG: hypothetical protein H6739_19940 [Alphaproteobacteria bacterium]|nr:hypothetical protein [Alphaproteobacteria bacterium]
MLDPQQPPAPLRRDPVPVNTLIVGFGFSVIPLLRELEARGQPYTLLSAGTPIWQQLAASDRLNFDLVSSFHASFYVHDQVEAGVVDNYYPTAQEFHDYHERLFAPYLSRITEDRVESVETHPTHSLVRTRSGEVYEAKKLVFATGLGRPQNETIKEIDLDEIEGQTVVFSSIGDTTNMMLARLVPQGNEIILLNNGFVNLDKYITFEIPGPRSQWYLPLFGVRTGKRYQLDLAQGEFHTIAGYWPRFYKDLFAIPLGPPAPESWFARTFQPEVFHVRFPETYRRDVIDANDVVPAGHGNGMSGIKYWPIDMYEARFGEELEHRIETGTLLNDIIFWHTEGLVQTWSKDRATIDEENKTVHCDGRIVTYDHLIGGGAELPRLPPIVSVDEDGRRHQYEYAHRNTFLGVVPAELPNVFFIGYTRPLTGGIANISEMQSLMVHTLLEEPERYEALRENLDERIAAYNARYYPPGLHRTATDHLVNFGLFTQDVAEFIGIGRPLGAALSLNPLKTALNLRFELLHPNNALKWRMQGRYAVPGAEELARRIAAYNEHWSIIMFLLLATFWDILLGYVCLGMMWVRYVVGPLLEAPMEAVSTQLPSMAAWTALCVVLALVLKRNHRLVNLSTYSLTVPLFGLKAYTMPIAMAFIIASGQWWWCPVLYGFWAGLAWLFRQFHKPPVSGRYLFADCKYKHVYRPFYGRYRERFLELRARRRGAASGT